MLESSYSFVTGSKSGTLDLYSPFEFEEKASSSQSKDDLLKSWYIMNRVQHHDEGAIVDVHNKILEAEREHCLIYCTQKGYMHIYDARARNPVFDFYFGIKNRCISAMTLGPGQDQALIGTLDGSILTYDFRYNVQASHCRYTKEASITNLQPFYPNRYRKICFNNAYHTSPLAFIATSDGNMSLADLSGNTGNHEVQIVMISSANEKKNNYLGSFKEKEVTAQGGSVYQSSVMSNLDMASSGSQIFKPRNRERLQNILKTKNQNSQTALLCPKQANLSFSASFILGGDTAGRIRYWNIEKDFHKCKHFYLAEEEQLSYKKKLYQNSFHIMLDQVTQKQSPAPDPLENFENFENPEVHSQNIHSGHSSTITALGMLYKETEEG